MIRLINSIECCPAKHLATAIPLSCDKVAITNYVPWKRIVTYGLISVETTDSLEKSIRQFQCKVTARVCGSQRPVWSEPMVFRLTTISGSQFLLGLSFKPYPTWTVKDVYAENPSDRSELQLNVSWKSVYSLMKIVE